MNEPVPPPPLPRSPAGLPTLFDDWYSIAMANLATARGARASLDARADNILKFNAGLLAVVIGLLKTQGVSLLPLAPGFACLCLSAFCSAVAMIPRPQSTPFKYRDMLTALEAVDSDRDTHLHGLRPYLLSCLEKAFQEEARDTRDKGRLISASLWLMVGGMVAISFGIHLVT